MKRLSFEEAASLVRQHAREFLDVVVLRKRSEGFGSGPCEPSMTGAKRAYSPPAMTRLTGEQATLFLVSHAMGGDDGARDLLELLFPGRKPGSGSAIIRGLEETIAQGDAPGLARIMESACGSGDVLGGK
jgi:hypothetical protein